MDQVLCWGIAFRSRSVLVVLFQQNVRFRLDTEGSVKARAFYWHALVHYQKHAMRRWASGSLVYFFASFSRSAPDNWILSLPGTEQRFILSPAHNFTCLCVQPHDFAFLNEQRNAHDEPGFQCRLFGCATGGSVAAESELCRRDSEFDVLWQL